MKIKVVLYVVGGEKLIQDVVDIEDTEWDKMRFSDKEKACSEVISKSFYWYWRELDPNETLSN